MEKGIVLLADPGERRNEVSITQFRFSNNPPSLPPLLPFRHGPKPRLVALEKSIWPIAKLDGFYNKLISLKSIVIPSSAEGY